MEENEILYTTKVLSISSSLLGSMLKNPRVGIDNGDLDNFVSAVV